MNASEYQHKSKRTLNTELSKSELMANMAMGISGEFGEAIDVIKKHLYQGHELNYQRLIEELGDGMWYIANLCNVLDIQLTSVLEENHSKLADRYPEGFDSIRSIKRKGEAH